jgi:hypothetical protein
VLILPLSFRRFFGATAAALLCAGVTAGASWASPDSVHGAVQRTAVSPAPQASLFARSEALASDVVVPAPQRGSSLAKAHAATDIASIVCGLLKKPVASAVNGLINVLSKDKIRTTLAGTLVAEIGFKPYCVGYLQKLRAVIANALRRSSTPPSLRLQMGPFVSNVYITFAGLFATVHWRPFDPSAPIVSETIELSENGSRYFPVTHFPVFLLPQTNVRFAVQLHDAARHNSLWAYSPEYRTS